MTSPESPAAPLESSAILPHPDPLADYRTLKPDTQAIVDLLAVNWGPLGLSRIKAGLDIPDKTRLDLGGLTRRGLLVRIRRQGYGSGGDGYACHPEILEPVARYLAAEGRFAAYAELARRASPLGLHYRASPINPAVERFESTDQFIREVRIGLYLHDEEYAQRMFALLERHRHSYWSTDWGRYRSLGPIYALICAHPFDGPWFLDLPVGIRKAALPDLLRLE